MPLSYATYTGNSGSPQSSFNIPYSYILKDHIKVYYGRDILANTQTALLTNGTDYNFTADNTIQLIGSTLNSGTTTGNPHNLANGVVLTLERDTPDSSQIVEFADGSNLIGDNLNNANLQNLFVVQEQQDKNDLSAAKAISSENASNTATTNVATLTSSQFNKDGSVPMTGDINANSNKIKNLADPTNAQDGVTKAYLERSGSITSTQIADGTIVNADVNASAAIAQSKLDIANATQSAAGYQSAADKTKLDGIETGATADQTDAEIRSLVESASDSNVFTDQDHAKLNGIEAGATADQTNAEIRAAVEAASDSNVFTDNDHSKLNAIEAGATADQTATEIKTLYESNSNTNPLTDAEKAVIDGVTANTSELNKLDGFTGSVADLNEVVTGKNVVEQITGSATDAQIPTAQAVNERVVELVTEVGGFHPIANETSFPTANPDINDGAGTIVSLKALTNSFSTGSGVTTHTFTNGTGAGNNVIINGLPSSTTFQAGKGLLLETTTTLHTYTYHRLVLDESGVSNADALVSNFNEKYYGPLSSNPATRPSGANRQNGDLYFNQSDGKMKVYNGTHASGTWDDVAAPGNFFINTLSSSSNSGGGSATFNGTATRFTLSNPPNEAQQLLVSINGVIQKPNAGTSPSEGFAVSGADIIFASAPLTGSSYFIVTIGSSVNIGTPSDNTVTSAKIVDGSIVNADISGSAAIASSKLAKPIDLLDNEKIRIGTGNDLQIYHDGASNSRIQNNTGALNINTASNEIWFSKGVSEYMARMITDGAVELYYDHSKKFETTTVGAEITGGLLVDIVDPVLNVASVFDYKYGYHASATNQQALTIRGNEAAIEVLASDQSYHGGSIILRGGNEGFAFINNSSDDKLELVNFTASGNGFAVHNGGATLSNYKKNIDINKNGSVDLYHNNSKKFETTSNGITVTAKTQIEGGSGDTELILKRTNTAGSNGNAFGSIKFNDENDNNIGRISTIRSTAADDGDIRFETRPTGGSLTERLRIKSDGNVQIPADNIPLQIGASQDLQIYHSSNNSIIDNSSSGYLFVQSNNLALRSTGQENMILCTANGSVNLYYDNSKKLETSSTGVTVSGDLTFADSVANDIHLRGGIIYGDDDAVNTLEIRSTSGNPNHAKIAIGEITNYDNGGIVFYGATNSSAEVKLRIRGNTDTVEIPDNHKFVCGDGSDLQIYHDGSSSYLDNDTGDLRINTASGEVQINKATSEYMARFIVDGAVELYHDNSKKFETTSGGTKTTGYHQQTAIPSFLAEHKNSDTHKKTGDLKNQFVRSFGTVRHNTGSHFSNSTGKFTAPVAGLYMFTMSMTFDKGDGVDDSAGCYFRVENNSGNYNRVHSNSRDFWNINARFFTRDGSEISQSFQTIELLDANATVGFYFTDFDDTTSELTVAFFSGHLIG